MAARLLSLFLVLGACTGDPPATAEEKTEPDAKPPPAAKPSADPEPATTPTVVARPVPPPVTRTRGPVEGKFVPEVDRIVAGAPFIVRFELTYTGKQPLTVTIGGDSFSQGQLRYAFLVRDESGDVVCDLRGRPEGMAGAGAIFEKTLAPGDTMQTYLGPQRGCPALMQPGRYTLRVVRVLVRDEDARGCRSILPPDTTVKPLDDRGIPIDKKCKRWLLAAPAIATEMTLDVTPYDPAAVRTAIDTALAQPKHEHRDHALSSYARWLCLNAGCEVQWGKPVRKWLPKSAEALPPQWPERK